MSRAPHWSIWHVTKVLRPYSRPVRHGPGTTVLLANQFLPTFRKALGVSGKTALIVSTRADKHTCCSGCVGLVFSRVVYTFFFGQEAASSLAARRQAGRLACLEVIRAVWTGKLRLLGCCGGTPAQSRAAVETSFPERW